MNTRFVVVDCETTGLGSLDRIVELAAVVLDAKTLEIVDEFDSLINPMRDVGKTDIHGITPSMVAAAPLLEEIIGAFAKRIDGAVLVAHNLSFDARLLAQECNRIGARFRAGKGVCTLRLSGESLMKAAARHGITQMSHHRALTDARAAALVFRNLFESGTPLIPAELQTPYPDCTPRTFRRESSDAEHRTSLTQTLARACYPSSNSGCLEYLDLLDWCLGDAAISHEEQRVLDDFIKVAGLTPFQVQNLHLAYYQSVYSAVMRDHVVSMEERRILERMASALRLTHFEFPEATVAVTGRQIEAGLRVCFTGSAVRADGSELPRSELEQIAAAAGFQPTASVTKKKCDLVVAADAATLSGKAQKARSYGIPIMSAQEFLDSVAVPSFPR